MPLLAQDAIYVYPPAPRTPVGGIQSITAIVTGNANKTVNWSTTCGTLIGSGNTIGLKSNSNQTCTVTATMAADSNQSATSTVTFEPVRQDLQAAGIHPRIWMTPADVTDLQAKAANPGNIVYTQGLTQYFAARATYYNSVMCWTGAGCGTVGPIGTMNSQGWVDSNEDFSAAGGGSFEQDAALYALMSLIDPTASNRHTWAMHAHDMAMWEMNEVCYNSSTGSGPCVPRIYSNTGQGTYTPFIGSQFIMNNRAQVLALPLIEALDWTYSTLSSTDKAVIANVGHVWGTQLTGANPLDVTDGAGEHVQPIGAYDNPAIISGGLASEEGGSNNFSLSHWQIMTAIGLLLDPADDPSTSSCATSATTICATDGSAQTVGAYGVYAVKGWLYRLYANFEDAHIVDNAYGLSDPFLCPDVYYSGTAPYNKTAPCTGSMSGGFPGEGTGYGYLSMSMMFPTTYILYQAGKLNPAVDPQASFISSAYWDKLALSAVAQLYPLVNGSANYTQIANDQNYSIQNPNSGILLNAMEVYDAKYGNGWLKNLAKWYQYNAEPYGYQNFFTRFMGGGGSGSYGSVLGTPLFPAYTMQATSATNDGDFSAGWQNPPTQGEYDPRNAATLPVDFENLSSPGGFYHYYGRTDWTTAATQFQFGCHTPAQSHADPACGRIDFIRNNEPLITGLGGSSNGDWNAQAPTHQNLPEYQWNSAFDCTQASVDENICQQGGMTDSGLGVSSNYVLASSSSSSYYFGATDATGAYNFGLNGCEWCSTAANVNLSQREVVWLKPDQIFIYDRAETTQNTTFKNFVLDLQTAPAISGNVATMTSTNGQELFVTSLLPGNSSLSTSALDLSHEPGAPVTALLTDTASTAASVRMLHTIEGKSSGSATSAALVESTSGTAFDGGLLGSTLVMFMHSRGSFSSVTYPASGGTTQYVADLNPNTTYTISGSGAPTSGTSDSAGLLTFNAAGTGSITITSAGTTAPTITSISVTPSSASIIALGTQQFAATCTYSDGSTSNCTSSVLWSSSASTIASVSSSGLATGIAQGTANVVATSGSVQGQASVQVPAPTLQSITVTPGSTTVTVGASQQFKATGNFSDSSTSDMTSAVQWSSSNTSLASVNGQGIATAMAPGSANILVTSGKIQGVATVTTVQQATTPSFSPAAGTYNSAQSVTLSTPTSGATIYYTTNGSTPTTGSAVYSGPITISSTETVQAIAVIANRPASSVSSATYTINLPTAAPTFSPAAGTFTSTQTVTLGSSTSGATIYYTTNGSTPTTSSPVYSGPISVSSTETVQAIAVASGYSASTASSATYTINLPTSAPTFSPAAGTFTSAQTVTLGSSTSGATIYYTTNGSTPTTSSPVYSGPISVSSTETLHAIAVASGYSASTASSATYTINLPAGAPTFSPAAGTYTSTQTVTLSTSTPSATIYYTTNGSTPTTSSTVYTGPITVSSTETLHAIATASGDSASSASAATYTINLPATAPVFSPAGGTYTSAQNVTLSSSTAGATIYFTTNGSTPTTSSAVYSGPITVSSTQTLQAVAIASGSSVSSPASATYTINLPAANPVFSPAGGSFTAAQAVTLSSATPGAVIHFTTDGSTPGTGSSVYSGPITVSASETLQAVAVASGYSTSGTSLAAFTISVPPAKTPVTSPAPTATPAPTFSPGGGTYTSAKIVRIIAAGRGEIIHYTTDGSTPTVNSPVYFGAVIVASSETLRAAAISSGHAISQPASATYTIDLPKVATPTFRPAPGVFARPQTVSISVAESRATIHYTTNGSTPTTSSPIYMGPIRITATETLKAIAVLNAYEPSSQATATYNIGPLASTTPGFSITLSPASMTLAAGQTGTTTVVVTPQNGYADTASLSCSGLPAGVSCSFSPATVATTNGPATSTMTIASAPLTSSNNGKPSPFFPGSAMAASVCCFGLGRRRRSQLLVLAGFAVGAGICSGCGSTSSISSTSPAASIQATVSIIATHGELAPATNLNLTLN
jgi:uncharacterized protein YjdB